MSDIGVEVWRGGVNPWECDGMGHLNVRFYVSIAMEGLAYFAGELGLKGAFSPAAPSTLLVRDMHIRYLREAHAHAPLHMTAGVVEIGDDEALIVQTLYHTETGEPSAAMQTRVAHVTGRDARPFGWSSGVRKQAEALKVELPDFAKARSVPQDKAGVGVSLARADELDLQCISRGVVGPGDVDAFGRMNVPFVIGRVSDGIGEMVGPFRRAVIAHSDVKPARVGGAALEYRTAHFAFPRCGDRYVIRSGVSGVDHRTQRIVHWMLDPDSGKPWTTAEATVTTFDLDRRKIVAISEAAQAVIGGRVKAGLRP